MARPGSWTCRLFVVIPPPQRLPAVYEGLERATPLQDAAIITVTTRGGKLQLKHRCAQLLHSIRLQGHMCSKPQGRHKHAYLAADVYGVEGYWIY